MLQEHSLQALYWQGQVRWQGLLKVQGEKIHVSIDVRYPLIH